MGAIGGLLGTAGGASGSGFSTPANANIQQGVTTADTGAANQGVNSSLTGSNALLSALQSQNGVQNQGTTFGQGQQLLSALQNGPGTNAQNVASYNTNALNGQLGAANGAGAQGAAIQGTGALAGQLGSANGVGTQQAGISGLQNTAAQLQGVANGTGPNPALAALNQQTGQNVANQAALMAGQRGAGANVGLLARQAAQQGAQTQQQAIGQAATLQSQQQLNALGQMGAANQAVAGAGATLTGQQQSALAQQGALGQGAVNQQQAGLNQQFGQGTQGVAQQQAQQQLNAGIAQNQVANTLGANNQALQGSLANQSTLLGGLGALNSANVSSQGSVNAGNTGLASTTMQGQQGLVGGVLNSAGGALGLGGGSGGGGGAGALAALGAEGGEVANGGFHQPKKMASGGSTSSQPFQMGMSQPGQNNPGQQAAFQMAGNAGSQALQSGMSNLGSSFATYLMSKLNPSAQAASADQAPMQSAQNAAPAPINVAADADPIGDVSGTSSMAGGGLAATGGHVSAKTRNQKAEKKGNSYDNDKVPAMLSEGEVVIPRSVMQSKDPAQGAARFIQALMSKKGA